MTMNWTMRAIFYHIAWSVCHAQLNIASTSIKYDSISRQCACTCICICIKYEQWHRNNYQITKQHREKKKTNWRNPKKEKTQHIYRENEWIPQLHAMTRKDNELKKYIKKTTTKKCPKNQSVRRTTEGIHVHTETYTQKSIPCNKIENNEKKRWKNSGIGWHRCRETKRQ